MRAVLVCLLAALAVSAAAANAPQPFKAQQSYVYRFDSQVSSSLIGASASEIQQQAATRLRADVHITFTNDRHANLALRHVRFGELNAELPKSQRVQPLEHFERRQIPETLKQQLEMPFSASYSDGVVERINYSEDDTNEWTRNIKRAVLSAMQLNLKRNDVQGLKMMSSIPEQEKDRNVNVFHIPEITLEGECEVVYTIQRERQNEQQDERSQFNVTKTINFGKCAKTADVSYGYQANPSQELRCLQCLKEQKTTLDGEQMEKARYTHCATVCRANSINDANDVERSTFVRYELQGKQDRYAIKRASVLSQYIVKAQNPASQNAIMQVVSLAELTFVEQSNDEKLVGAFKQSSQDETLLYVPEWDLKEKRWYMAGDEEFEKNSPFARVPQKDQRVAHLMRTILKQWQKKEQGYELSTAMDFNRLVRMLREASVQELRKIEDVIRSDSEQTCDNSESCKHHAQALYIDALAVAATRNTLFMLAQKITKSSVSNAQAVQALQLYAANMIAPSEQQVELLQKLASHEAVHRSAPLKQATWLTFGAAVGSLCQDKPSQGQREHFNVEQLCSRGKKQQWKNTLMQMFRDASNTYEKILALKTIGNAALDNTIEELQRIVANKRIPTLIRLEGVDALRRLRTSQATKIQATLLPIFADTKEQPEIRMAAVSMLLYTLPERAILDQLAFSVMTDKSSHVKSFVLSALETLSRSPCAAEQEISKHLKSSLKVVRIDENELRASRRYRVPIYSSEPAQTSEQHLFARLASIVSPSNALPIHLSASLHQAFNGEATEEAMQLSFTQKNVEQWLRQLSDAFNGEESDNDDMEDEQQQKRSANNERRSAKDLNSIYQSIGIKSRRTGSYFISDEQSEEAEGRRGGGDNNADAYKPFGMFVLRAGDVDIAMLPLSEQTMPRVIRKVFMEKQKPTMTDIEELMRQMSAARIEKHAAASLGERKTKIPTTAGLPLAFIRQMTVVASVEAQMKTQFESSDLSSSKGLETHLKMRMSAVATHMHKTETWTPMLKSGVQTIRTVEWNTPVELKIRADKQKVEIRMMPPRDEKVRFFGMHTLPLTYTRQTDMETQQKREARVKSVHNWALEHTQRELRGDDQSERAIVVDGHYHALSDVKQMIQAMYTTENNVHWYLNAEKAPREIVLRVSGSAFEKHEQHSRPEFDDFYQQSQGFSSVYEEDDNNMESERDEQRSKSLSTYNRQYNGQQAYRHQLKIEAEAKYPQHTARMMAEIKGACDRRMKHCKVFVDAQRSPIRSLGESEQWQMTAKLQTIAPEIIRDAEEMDSKQSRALMKVDAQWGMESAKNEVQLRVQAEPTKMWQQGQNAEKVRFLNKLDAIVNYKLRPQTRAYAQTVYEMLKARHFWSMTTQQRRGEENVVRATIVVDPITRRHANVSVQTPHERVRVEGMEVPTTVLAATYYQLERRPSNYQSVGQVFGEYTGLNKAECRINDRRIRTFDDVSYRAPLTHCYSVIASDASEQQRFAVLMKKEAEERTRVKIVTKQSVIELTRRSPNEKIEVTVDGQRVHDEERLADFNIEQTHDKVYYSRNGLDVEFDGELKVKLSQMYKNAMSGLCGHYNDEAEDEFQTADNKRSSSLKEFHRSFVLKNQDCDESRLNKLYQKDDEDFDMSSERKREQSRRRYSKGNRRSQWFDESDEQNERRESEENWMRSDEQSDLQNIKPIEKTEVIEYSHKICFSTEPLRRCPRGTTPDDEAKTQPKKTQFFCLERSSRDAKQLMRQARRGGQIDNQGRQPSFVETIEQPTKCVAY